MANYNYDDSGAIFNFFLLTLLALFLIPYTLNKRDATKREKSLLCPKSIEKQEKILLKIKKNSNFNRFIILAVGWSLFVFVVYRAATMEIVEQEKWNPWDILGVSEGMDKSEIKKSFRSLSLKFHPDKVASEEKEEAEKKFVDISKAYKILTNEEAKKVFDETGNPDGTESFKLGLALPKWLVEEDNNMLVLFLYALIFGLGLPFAVSRWWSMANQLNVNKIMNSTMAIFYRDLKENSVFRAVLETISKAEEFSTLLTYEESESAELDELVSEIHSSLEGKTYERFDRKRGRDVSKLQEKVCILLVSHLARVTPKSQKLAADQAIVAVESAKLANGLLQIAVSRLWLTMALSILELSQMICQALYYKQSPLYQLPYIDSDILKHFDTKKRKIGTIKEYLALPEAEQTSLLRTLSSDQFQTLTNVAKAYPLLKVTKAKFAVIGEPLIIPGSLVTLIVEIKLLKEYEPDTKLDTTDSDGTNEEDEPINSKWWESSSALSKFVHAPYFPEEKRETWWVFLSDPKTNRIIAANHVRAGPADTQKVFIKFAAPPEKGTWKFQVIVKSDSTMGCDLTIDIALVVHPTESAPPIVDDDYISEPEEDTLSGQMEALRRQNAGVSKAKKPIKKKAPANKKYQDAEDSTDSETDPVAPKKGAGACDDDCCESPVDNDFIE